MLVTRAGSKSPLATQPKTFTNGLRGLTEGLKNVEFYS